MTDPELKTTYYTHDAVGRITGITRPDGGALGFVYDANGNMTVLTNSVDVDHGFSYNGVNLRSGYETPVSGSYSYLYDKDRRLIRTNFPSGKQIKNIYTNTRLTQIQTPEDHIDLTYRCGDTVASMTKGGESISYAYDGKLPTDATLGGTLNQSLHYVYNNDFNVTAMTYAGSTENFNYDLDGLLTEAGGFSISRNAGNGLPESVTGSGLNINRGFNGYGELADQTVSAY